MSCGGGGRGEEKQWSCGKPGAVNLQRVSSMVRDIGEPCLPQSPIKVSRMLKTDKWQATFDSDGKVSGFQKALKSIVLGGIDPSIRAEVWEFLLGCYSLGSTAEHRRKLRTARRERYEDLVKQCQMMHASVGTGSLAYVVGSKVMDMRTTSKDERTEEVKSESREISIDTTNKLENYSDWNNNCTDTSYACERESSSDSAEIVSVRGSTDSAAYESSCFLPTYGPYFGGSPKAGEETHDSQYVADGYFDFPPLPVTNLFDRSGQDEKECSRDDSESSTRRKLRFEDDRISFQINNNVDLIMESTSLPSNNFAQNRNSKSEIVHHDGHEPVLRSSNLDYERETVNRLRISDVPQTSLFNVTSSQGETGGDDRVSEWLWTLHRIVVDVVRTDSHLEFYEDKRNLARMSDILAVYAWIDPATGYCQGMSDLLSPFVVLFEDNADAFWCFEMLLRRMRENFQMEGPTGVMKQLQALWHILELTDREMFAHLSRIGAESLHFAFRMLMVLFRRELSFTEALRMWEMMWAADFDESMVRELEEYCPEALVLHIPRDSMIESREEDIENGNGSSKDGSQMKQGNIEQSSNDSGMKSASPHPFCGLTRSFWSRNDRMQISTVISSTKNGDDELPVFCVAAILIINRQKIIKETRSIDDLIKIFNDKQLKIHIRRCVRTAIKLRKKYFYKMIKNKTPTSQNGE